MHADAVLFPRAPSDNAASARDTVGKLVLRLTVGEGAEDPAAMDIRSYGPRTVVIYAGDEQGTVRARRVHVRQGRG